MLGEGPAYPEVVAEVERLQTRKSSLLGGVAILLISLLMFVVIGTGGKSGWTAGPQARQTLLILVPVLLFHELGHYVAMRVFGYRNVRMFFIPMFGGGRDAEPSRVVQRTGRRRAGAGQLACRPRVQIDAVRVQPSKWLP